MSDTTTPPMTRPDGTPTKLLSEADAAADMNGTPRPKRAKKAKAPKPPKVEAQKRVRTKPVQTLKARVAAISPAHLDAFRFLTRNDEEFADGLRDEFDYAKRSGAAYDRVELAKATLLAAQMNLDNVAKSKPDGSFRARLDRLAASIANEVEPAKGDEPSEPDTAPPRHDDE